MNALVHAIPIAVRRTGRDVVLIGGLAVICRLGSPYRATTDVDTVDRRRGDDPSQLDLLLRGGAEQEGPSGALIDTPAGSVRLDVLEVKDSDFEPLVAMKLQSLPNRTSAKEATDLLDISKLLLDRSTAMLARSQLASATVQIREDVSRHVDLWFLKNASASASRMRHIPEGHGTTRNDVRFLGELLTETLR
jgi:hypothetical protein